MVTITSKPWWTSKTLWVNLAFLAGFVLQGHFGYVVEPELELACLGIINVVLRAITKKPLDW